MSRVRERAGDGAVFINDGGIALQALEPPRELGGRRKIRSTTVRLQSPSRYGERVTILKNARNVKGILPSHELTGLWLNKADKKKQRSRGKKIQTTAACLSP